MHKLTDNLHTYTATLSIMTMTVRAKNQAEAEQLYNKWTSLDACPECRTTECEHYEIYEEVFHTWEREQGSEPLGDDPVTITFNSLKSAQNEAWADGVQYMIRNLRDQGVEITPEIEALTNFVPYGLAPIE
jgi:hypothetical protein